MTAETNEMSAPCDVFYVSLSNSYFPREDVRPHEMNSSRFNNSTFQRITWRNPKWIDNTREKVGNASDLELLQKTFDRMKYGESGLLPLLTINR
jgi:hypothetical protein